MGPKKPRRTIQIMPILPRIILYRGRPYAVIKHKNVTPSYRAKQKKHLQKEQQATAHFAQMISSLTRVKQLTLI